MIALMLGAAVLTGWDVWAGSPSAYYASIAMSMSESWSNFLFGSMDPAGTVTLDKIPGSFWIPALFVKVFGYSAWAVIIPNALAAVGAVGLTAVAVRRVAGVTGALLAGAVVATTPILVAVARSNQPEMFFVLALAAALWASMRALQARSLGWLTLAGVFIGAAFQCYMLEAWAAWPALATAYLLTKQSWWRRIRHLLIAGTVSIVASLWWIAVVSLVPAGSRPYIGSTLTNSPWEMVFGYNGLGRFGSSTADTSAYRSFTPPFSGGPGVNRLFNDDLAGQIAWLIPVAVVAIVLLWVLRVPRTVALLVTVWFATYAVMFSVVAGMHQFYTASLAIPIAAAIGIAVGRALRARRVVPIVVMLVIGALTAVLIGVHYGSYSVWAALIQTVLAAGAIALVLTERAHGLRAVTAIVTMAALLFTPTVWSAVTVLHPNSTNPVAGGSLDLGQSTPSFAGGAGFPGGGTAAGFSKAGPGSGNGGAFGGGGGGPRGGFSGANRSGGSQRGTGLGAAGAPGVTGTGVPEVGSLAQRTAVWLEEHRGHATYIAAAFGAQSAAEYILASNGESVLPIGGFSARDPIPTLAGFIKLVSSGELRYVLTSSMVLGPTNAAGTGDTTDPVSEIHAWVEANCTAVTDAPSSALMDCAAAG